MQQIPEQIPANAITYICTTGEPAIVRTNHAGLIDALAWSPLPSHSWRKQVAAAALAAPVALDSAGLGDSITIVGSVAR